VLHELHFLRILESSFYLLTEKIAFCASWKLSNVDQTFALVSLQDGQIPAGSDTGSELLSTYQNCFLPLFGFVQTPKTRQKAAVPICENARQQYFVSLKNNITVNFESRTRRWIRLKLLKWCSSSSLVFENIPTKKALGPIIQKIFSMIQNREEIEVDEELMEELRFVLKLDDKSVKTFIEEILKKGIFDVATCYLGEEKVSDQHLKSNWSRYLPWFHLVLKESETWLEFCSQKLTEGKWDQRLHNRMTRGVRLFHLCPQNKIAMSHVRLTNRSLRYLGCEMGLWSTSTTEKQMQDEPEKYWGRIFDFVVHGKRRPSLVPNWGVMTDGVCASLLYARKGEKPKNAKARKCEEAKAKRAARLQNPDFCGVPFQRLENLPPDSTRLGLDPGNNQIFWAVSKDSNGKRDEHHFSKENYRQVSRYYGRRKKARKKKVKWREKDVEGCRENEKIEDNNNSTTKMIASTKTASLKQFIEAWKLRVTVLEAEWKEVTRKLYRRFKFDSFIGRQEGISAMAHSLLDHYEKKEVASPIVIAFGSARFSGAPTKTLHHYLTKQCKAKCIVQNVAEPYTSQKCPICEKQTLRVVTHIEDEKKGIVGDDEEECPDGREIVYGLKACPCCSKIFNRDSMGAENILKAWESMNTTGKRPTYLCKPTTIFKKEREIFYDLDTGATGEKKKKNKTKKRNALASGGNPRLPAGSCTTSSIRH
jgi:hypothetical protein